MTDIKNAPKFLKTDYGKINKANKFKNEGEIIIPNPFDNESNKVKKNGWGCVRAHAVSIT